MTRTQTVFVVTDDLARPRLALRELAAGLSIAFRQRAGVGFAGALAALALRTAFMQSSGAASSLIAAMSVLMLGVVWWSSIGTTTVRRGALLAACALTPIVAPDTWWTGVPFICLAAARAGNVSGWQRQASVALAIGLALALMGFIVEASGLLWQEISDLSWMLTGLISASLRSTEVHLGPAVSPLPTVFVAGCLWVAQIAAGRVSIARHLRTFLILVVGAVLSLAFGQQLLAILIAGFVAAVPEWRASRPDDAPRRSWAKIIGVSLCAAGVALLAYLGVGSGAGSRPKVFCLVDAGMQTTSYLDATNLVAHDTQPSFTVLHDLLRNDGWETRTTPIELQASDLEGVGVLCVINLDSHIPAASLASIQGFVRDGGRLMVLADHTDIGGTMGPTNDLLGFTSIRVRFDSAIPLDRPSWKWRSCLRGSWHPAYVGRTNESFGISVGASLDVHGDAHVLVIGDRGFSDWGNPDFGVSKLGDMQYKPGERYGGLPLVARQRIGDGVVEVWGDTTGFQSSVLTGTYGARLAAIGDLLERTPTSLPRAQTVVAAMAIACVGIWLLARSPIWLLGAMIAAAGVGSLATHAAAIPDRSLRAGAGLPIVAFDTSHDPLYPGVDSNTWISGFADVTRRCGKVLLKYEHVNDMIDASPATIVIAEPTKAYDERDAEAILRYMREGGQVMIAAGPGANHTLAPLLGPLGLSISDRTMGAAHNARVLQKAPGESAPPASSPPPVTNDHSHGAHAEPEEVFVAYDAEMAFKESFPVNSSITDNHEVLIECWGSPLAVRRVIGKGALIVVGDPKFFTESVVHRGPVSNLLLEERNARFLVNYLAR